MHLTNYAINKHSKDFIRDEETGSKRYFSFGKININMEKENTQSGLFSSTNFNIKFTTIFVWNNLFCLPREIK